MEQEVSLSEAWAFQAKGTACVSAQRREGTCVGRRDRDLWGCGMWGKRGWTSPYFDHISLRRDKDFTLGIGESNWF